MIDTPEQLAARIGVHKETLAIAAQTKGVIPYLRHAVEAFGTTVIVGTINGKIERAGDCFERVTGQRLEKRRANASKL